MTTNSQLLKQKLNKQRNKMIGFGISIFIVTICMVILFVGMGKAHLSFTEVYTILLSKLTLQSQLIKEISPYKEAIVMDIRLPRVLTALLVGFGLAIAGTVFQALLMNPLADPYTI